MKMKRGFTLVEVLVVIAIIGVLALLILPNFVGSFRNATNRAMITQENEVVDAVKLFIEDYCRHPLSQNKGQCYNYSIPTSDTNKRYTCLSTLQNTKYIDEIISQGESCAGFIIYGKDYSSYKAYLQCGAGYQTSGVSDLKDSNGLNIIDICGGAVTPPPPTQPPASTAPIVASGTLMQAEYGNASTNFLRTNIAKKDIEKITFVNRITGHSANGTDCWDVSAEENGSVLAWATDTDSNGKYELTIGSNGKVYASDGKYLFMYLTNLISMNGMQYFDTSNVTYMTSMFYGCENLESLNVSYLNTSKVKDMHQLFGSCKKLTTLDVSNFDTSNVTGMYRMFYYCNNLETVDVSNFNTSKVTNMGEMFYGCEKLTTLDVSHFDTSNVTNMASMFNSCYALTNLDVSHFNTSKVTSFGGMFGNCRSLTSLDVTHFDTSQATNFNSMFGDCRSLTSLDVSHFNTSKATAMASMFTYTKLSSIDVSHFDTSNVTTMSSMFSGCTELTSIDVSHFDTSKVTDMYAMFLDCRKLTSLDVSNFNTSNVTNLAYFVSQCTGLTSIDLTHFDTSKVTLMTYMFWGDKFTTLDLSSFNTSSVRSMNWMFRNCSRLKTIYVSSGWSTNSVTESAYMFDADSSLVGGAGTVYNSNHVDKEYAHIDGGTSNPGYLTDKSGTKVTATFYYNSNTTNGEITVSTATAQCVSSGGASCTISVPTVVTNSVGKYNSPYKGVSTNTGTMASGSLNINTNSVYYATYSKSVLLYYYDSAYSSKTVYRNEYFTSNTAMASRLSNSATSVTNYSTAGGPGSSLWDGLSTGNDTTAEYTTVQQAANSNSSNLYSIYEFTVNYQIGANVSAIGSPSSTCNVTSTNKSCVVVLPTISVNTGYTSVGWSKTNGATTGTAALATYTVDTNNLTLYGNAKGSTYTVSFNANGGTGGQTANVTATYGSAMPTISTTAPTRDGYAFTGWYDASSGGTKYYNANGTSARTYNKTSNSTMYAHWEKKTITVNFYRNHSSTDTAVKTQTFTYGNSANNKFGYNTSGTAIWGTAGEFGDWTNGSNRLLGWSASRTATSATWGVYSGVSDNWINTNYPSIDVYAVWGNCSATNYRNCVEAKFCYPNGSTFVYSNNTGGSTQLSGTINKAEGRAVKVYYIGQASNGYKEVVVITNGICSGLKSWYGTGGKTSSELTECSFTPNCGTSADICTNGGFQFITTYYNPDREPAYRGYVKDNCVTNSKEVHSGFSSCTTSGTYYCAPA